MRLITVRELIEIIGREKIGRPTAYHIARRYGFKLGKRLVIPENIVNKLLSGDLFIGGDRGKL